MRSSISSNRPARSRIQAIVEIEDPVADVGEARVHGRAAPSRQSRFIKMKGFVKHKVRRKAENFQ